MEELIILGTGCAGLTAAIYAARANLNPLVIEGGQPGGQLTTTSEVENFPGFPDGVDGFELMDRLRKQAERFGARTINEAVTSVESTVEGKTLHGASRSFETKSLIIATGASPRLLGIPGEKEMFGGRGVTTCATCDGAFYRDMDVVVIGGGDSACEEALFLTRFCSRVSLIHRRDTLRASKIMAGRALKHATIEPVWNSVVEEMLADGTGFARGVAVRDVLSDERSEIACKGIFLAIGHTPNTVPFAGILELDANGYIITQPNGGVVTNQPGVFAAGDCVDHIYRQAITAAGMGCQAAIETERWLAEHE